MAKVRILKDGEAASIKYLTNAQGQQVFKSEPKPDQYLPDQSQLGTGFIAWLKTNFGWLYAQAQTDASLGSAYMYADGQLPSWAVLGEYDNGSASGAGRTEYIWLPTEDSGAVPVGMFRNSKFFAIHSDHLGTPRLMTDSLNKPVWQWPYSAFGNNKPTGILKPTTSATGAFTNQPVLLATQTPAAVLDLRFPGQMADEETGLFYNYFRTYQPGQGRFTQSDPIGMDGGLNRFSYANGAPTMYADPLGLWSVTIDGYAGVGGGMTFGRDSNTGQGFMNMRAGWGAGGGFKWEKSGGRPGSEGATSASCKSGGIGAGVFGNADFNAGPFQAGLQNSLGRNSGQPTPYGQFMSPSWSLGDSWGVKAGWSAGGQVTIWGRGK